MTQPPPPGGQYPNQGPTGPQGYPGQPNQFPQQGAYAMQPVKKPWYKRVGCLIGIALVVIALAIIGGCMALVGGAADSVDKASKKEHTVTYEIEGDAQSANATFTSGSTDTAQETGLRLPWTKTVTLTGFGAATLTATNGYEDDGAITCRIKADGKVVSENRGSGKFASASCSVLSSDLPK